VSSKRAYDCRVRRPRDLFRPYARSLSLALGGGVILVGALVAVSRRVAEPPVHRGPLVDSQANCQAVATRYQASLLPFQTCTRDDECVAERRDGVRSGLDGCARFRRADARLGDAVDPLEHAWLDRGCAQLFMTCPGPRRAQCAAGKCAELPPEPVPRTWRREQHTGFTGPRFSFFVPPDLVRKDVIGEDSEVGAFEGPSFDLEYEYGDYSPSLIAKPDDEEIQLRNEATTIAGVPARLVALRTRSGDIVSGAYFAELPSLSREKPALVIYARCKTEADCADGVNIARSLEFH
jgi:hypothetical protein